VHKFDDEVFVRRKSALL